MCKTKKNKKITQDMIDKYEKKRKIKIVVLISFTSFFLILCCLALFGYGYLKSTEEYDKETMFVVGQTDQSQENQQVEQKEIDVGLDLPDNSMQYKGDIYVYNDNLINILFIGVDEENDYTRFDKMGLNTAGHADMLMLLSIDSNTNNARIISIPRDSWTEIKMHDHHGEYTTTIEAQITTAHAYGSSQEMAAELTVDAVSYLLYGIPINRYFNFNMDAVVALTDEIGGVELEMLDDFSRDYNREYISKWESNRLELNKMKKGETVNLNGEQAKMYVKQRMFKGMEAGDFGSRRPRQMQFARGFLEKVKEMSKKNPLLPFTLLDVANDYIIYDLRNDEISFLIQTVLSDDFNTEEIITIPGEVEITEEENYYFVDALATKELVVNLFYKGLER